MCGRLKDFRDTIKEETLHIEIAAEVRTHLSNPEHPLNRNPGLAMNCDLYCDTLEWAMLHQPQLLGMILKTETDPEKGFSPDDITRFGMQVSMVMVNSQQKANYGTALQKVKTVTSKGLTKEGLELLNKVRVTQCHSSKMNMVKQHATFALEMFRKHGMLGTCSLTLDNLDTMHGGVLMHFCTRFFFV